MEKKKFDANSFIGILLLGAIMLWYMYSNQEEVAPKQDTTEQVSDPSKTTIPTKNTNTLIVNDSIKNIVAKQQLGSFAYGAQTAKEGTTVLENSVLKLVIDNRGGQIVEALVKNYKTYDFLPLYLIKDNNASFNINFGTTDNRTLNTKDLLFTPVKTKNGENEVLSMKVKVSETQFLEYRYEMKPDDYMLGFAVRSQGLSNVINSSNAINLDWSLKTFRNEKSIKTENMYSELKFYTDEADYLSASGSDNEIIDNVQWAGFKQHFFTSILLTDTPFNKAAISSNDLVKDEAIDTVFTKQYDLKTPLALNNGELNYNMNWYYGPADYKTLKSYEGKNLGEIVDLGWGIFGAINRTIFIPIFDLLSGWMSNYGLIIILMTIVVRILMSPLVYKSYVSSAKMKVIRPELTAINERLPGKENAMKRQQETMAVQRKAGVSMMSGCIPALLQMPIFFALFRFFPSNLELRQKGFLWADDLSSYDAVFQWEMNIPIISSIYGNHMSLFPILASVAIFFYMKMNQSQQANMQAPAQEGMPDMQKMMKWMIYLSPLMMLFFFNNYASSLSLYYFISNLLTIVIMLVIKHYVIDEKKIIAQIEENKKRPEKKKSKFRERMDAAMKQAQEQQAQNKKKK